MTTGGVKGHRPVLREIVSQAMQASGTKSVEKPSSGSVKDIKGIIREETISDMKKSGERSIRVKLATEIPNSPMVPTAKDLRLARPTFFQKFKEVVGFMFFPFTTLVRMIKDEKYRKDHFWKFVGVCIYSGVVAAAYLALIILAFRAEGIVTAIYKISDDVAWKVFVVASLALGALGAAVGTLKVLVDAGDRMDRKEENEDALKRYDPKLYENYLKSIEWLKTQKDTLERQVVADRKANRALMICLEETIRELEEELTNIDQTAIAKGDIPEGSFLSSAVRGEWYLPRDTAPTSMAECKKLRTQENTLRNWGETIGDWKLDMQHQRTKFMALTETIGQALKTTIYDQHENIDFNDLKRRLQSINYREADGSYRPLTEIERLFVAAAVESVKNGLEEVAERKHPAVHAGYPQKVTFRQLCAEYGTWIPLVPADAAGGHEEVPAHADEDDRHDEVRTKVDKKIRERLMAHLNYYDMHTEEHSENMIVSQFAELLRLDTPVVDLADGIARIAKSASGNPQGLGGTLEILKQLQREVAISDSPDKEKLTERIAAHIEEVQRRMALPPGVAPVDDLAALDAEDAVVVPVADLAALDAGDVVVEPVADLAALDAEDIAHDAAV